MPQEKIQPIAYLLQVTTEIYQFDSEPSPIPFIIASPLWRFVHNPQQMYVSNIAYQYLNPILFQFAQNNSCKNDMKHNIGN